MIFSLSKIDHCKRSIPSDAKLRIIRGVFSPLFDHGSLIYLEYGLNKIKKGLGKTQLALKSYSVSSMDFIVFKLLGLLDLFMVYECTLYRYTRNNTEILFLSEHVFSDKPSKGNKWELCIRLYVTNYSMQKNQNIRIL